jgi:hypothetical protein
MCMKYNMIGSLKTLKARLEENNITDFKSLKEVIDFQQSFTFNRQQLISHHENLIQEEKNMLKLALDQLDVSIETQREQTTRRITYEIDQLTRKLTDSIHGTQANFFQKIISFVKQWNYKRQIKRKARRREGEVEKSISKLVDQYQIKNKRFQFIQTQFSVAVEHSSQQSLTELDRKKRIIDELSSFIYGALGEQQVAKKLESLSDEYFLINDFEISFSPPIYNSKEKDYIKSVQIDHVLIAPSGIFLIETKNWSEKSLENLSLRSPVEQIKRTSFVLFKLLNNQMGNVHLRLDKHHWGDKKITIKNLIVFTNTKPKEEFQFVKILTLNQLLDYVGYFEPIFSSHETKSIADFLIRVNDQKTLLTK